MKKIFGFFISVLFIIGFVRCWTIPGLNFITDTIIDNKNEDSEKPNQNLNKPKSKPDINKDKIEINSFYNDHNVVCETDIIKYGNLLKTIDNYVQRYINLFLIISNLHEYEVTDSTKEIIIDLEISITEKDLAFLQNYVKNMQDPKYPRNFSKLDDILSKIARARQKSYMENAMKSFKSFFSGFNIIHQLFEPGYYRILSFIIIFTALWTFAVFLRKYILLLVIVIVHSGIIWEGLIIYKKKVEEKEIENFVSRSQWSSLPEDCDPKNKGWYQGIMKVIFGDNCVQYFKEVNKNPSEEVSLFNCIVDSYSFYLIRMPSKLFGASIKDVVGEISSLWPWPLNLITNIPLILIFSIMSGFVILILCGKRLRLSVLGAAVEIGDNVEKPVNKTIPITSNEVTKSTRIIRKLKPWTKSRFPKRLDGDLIKRRKLYRTASKSITDSPVEDETPSVNSTQVNRDPFSINSIEMNLD